jgi:hypothetical protein
MPALGVHTGRYLAEDSSHKLPEMRHGVADIVLIFFASLQRHNKQ